MNNKLLRKTFVITVLLIQSNSFANTFTPQKSLEFYLGVQLGDNIHSKANHCEDCTVKEKGMVERVIGGVDFNKYMGLELGLSHYPQYEIFSPNNHVKYNQNSIDLFAKGTLPIYRNLSLVGKLGLLYEQVSADYLTIGEKQHADPLRPAASLGISYAFSPKVMADISYLKPLDSSKGAYLFGLTFKLN